MSEQYEVLVQQYQRPKNNAIQIYTARGPYDKPSINPDVVLAADEIALHPADYHATVIKWLEDNGWIGKEVLDIVPAGNYDVEVRKLLKRD